MRGMRWEWDEYSYAMFCMDHSPMNPAFEHQEVELLVKPVGSVVVA